jgi:plasmid stabilization system protein ParE
VNVVLRPDAVVDLRAARDYYDAAGAGLGDEFATELDRLFERLTVFPRSAPVVADYDAIRRAHMRRFPFGVFYQPVDDEIVVLRVIHTSRSPENWPAAETS